METVKPLTWEADKVAEEIRQKYFPYTNHPMYPAAKEFIAWGYERGASRVRAIEEANSKLSEIVTHFEHEMELTKSLLEASEEENKRLQERLEAAENDRNTWFKRYQDISYSKYGGTNP